MSKTSIDIVNILYSHIKNSAYLADSKKPNGDLCKFERPVNSDKEDTVINSLPISKEAIQAGILNVNIYVKNLFFPLNPADRSQPDTARISYLSRLFSNSFEEFDGDSGNYTFRIQQDNVFKDDNNQHYINFRIEFSSVNI